MTSRESVRTVSAARGRGLPPSLPRRAASLERVQRVRGEKPRGALTWYGRRPMLVTLDSLEAGGRGPPVTHQGELGWRGLPYRVAGQRAGRGAYPNARRAAAPGSRAGRGRCG